MHTPDGERLYYMGSNGPHSGSQPHRNASLGLATLRTDGFGGYSGTGTLTTVPIRATAPHVTITADVLTTGGFIRITVTSSSLGIGQKMLM